MSFGIPVISTSKGIEGLAVEDGKNVILANTPREFVHNIMHLMADRELRMSLGLSAREYISMHHLPDSVMDIFERALYTCRMRE